MATTSRNVRVADDPWIPASERAKAEGTDISAVIRAFLTEYAAGAPQTVQQVIAQRYTQDARHAHAEEQAS